MKPNVFLVTLQRTLCRFNVSAAARNQQKSENVLGGKFGGGELCRRSSQSCLRSGSSARGPILGSEQEPERHGAVFRSWRRRFRLPFPAGPLQPPASHKYPATQLLYSSFHLFVHSCLLPCSRSRRECRKDGSSVSRSAISSGRYFSLSISDFSLRLRINRLKDKFDLNSNT